MNEFLDIVTKAVKREEKTKPYDTTAKVTRIDGDTVWVHIDGGVDETPVRKTIDASVGDTVQVRVGGGTAFLVGNGTAPPTDDRTANFALGTANTAQQDAQIARQAAESAEEAAGKAWEYADSAHTAATTAWNYADQAHNEAVRATGYANDALTQLSTVEDVVDTLNWITDHGTMTLTTDTAIDPTHVYFMRDANGDYVVDSYHYRLVTEPKVEELNTYYELSIDEAVSNYVASHLALTNDGLYVVKDNQGYKVLLANDGLKIYDAGGHVVSTFGESITFDSERPQTIGNATTHLKWYDSNNDHVADAIEISGDVNITNTVTIGGNPQSDYLNSNISVGGRNLLRGTASVIIGSGTTEGSWANAKFYKSGTGTLETASVTNPLNLTNVIKATATTANTSIGFAQSAVPIVKDTVTLSAWVKGTAGDDVIIQCVYEDTGDYRETTGVSKTFTISDSGWHIYSHTYSLNYDHSSGIRAGYIYVRSASANRAFYICGAKLEYGNKATNWSPAQEDVNADIDDARTKATSYITHIDNNGIYISPASQTPSSGSEGNSVLLNGNGMEVYNDGVSLANFGSSVRVGRVANGFSRTEVTSGGMQIYQRNNGSDIVLANIGYGSGNAQSGTAVAPYYTIGSRKSGSAVGNWSVAEGYETTASNWASHAEGAKTISNGGGGSHAEGGEVDFNGTTYYTTASGVGSHAEGGGTIASGDQSHAEGLLTSAGADSSHAEGYKTTASGAYSHAEGESTTASGIASHSSGRGTTAQGSGQTVVGKYNVADSTSLFIVGNGTGTSTRKNALIVDSNGNAKLKGFVYMNCSDTSTGGINLRDLMYLAGDTITDLRIHTAAYLTTNKTNVNITLSLGKLIGANTFTPSSVKLVTRQNGNYTHGCTSSTYVDWTVDSCSITSSKNIFLSLLRTSDTTNAVNNAPIGIALSLSGEFS